MSGVEDHSFPAGVAAIAVGDLAELERLLDREPALVEARNPAPVQATLLHHTAFNGSDMLCHAAPPATPALARLLLERGAAPDALAFGDPRGTALCWALSSWFTHSGGVQTQLADTYLDGGAKLEGVTDDGAPLGHAIGFGYTHAVDHLAQRGANVDHLYAAAALGDVDRLASWRRPDGSFDPAAFRFARSQKAETGRFSWPPPRDADPAALALVTAATHGRVELVRWLLDLGTPPDATVTRGQTALHFAAYVGHPSVVALLLERGASRKLRETQFDRTAAEWARETGEEKLATLIEAS